ncbi:MAG: metallophosphoesterase family protein [Chthonomonadales bacterium]
MAEAIPVMHFADTHFGVETYGRLDPETGLNSRLIDFRTSLNRAIEAALERNVQLAVFAGDAYKARDPSQTHQREFASCIRKLTQAGVPVVMLTGNHDVPGVRGRAHAMEIWSTLAVEGVRVFAKPDVAVIDTKMGPVQIAAMPYLMKGFVLAREEMQGLTADEVRERIEKRYADYLNKLAQKVEPSLPTILVAHLWADHAKAADWQQAYLTGAEPKVSAVLTVARSFDYVALGHIHRFQDLNPGGQPPIVYCGSPDRIDFGEANEEKGFVMVYLRKGDTKYEFVRIANPRLLVDIRVKILPEDADPTGTIVRALQRHPLAGNIVRLTIEVPEESAANIREAEIREAGASAFILLRRIEVQRRQALRMRFLSEALDPMVALKHYLEREGRSPARAERLLELAGALDDELRRKEELR